VGSLAIILLSVVLVLAPTPAGATVTYDFAGLTFDGRLEAFRFTVPNFLPVPPPSEPVQFLHVMSHDGFLPCHPIDCVNLVVSFDFCFHCVDALGLFFANEFDPFPNSELQFDDENNSGYAYLFPLHAFSELGIHLTVGVGNFGVLIVRTPFAGSLFLLGVGMCLLLWLRLSLQSTPARRA